MEMTDIRQLKAFVAVAEELNFHRAAEKLGTVQPALSRMIRNLEADMNVTLLLRTTRSVTLTESGKVFLGEARLLLNQLTSAIRTTQAAERGTVGSLSLAYMDFAVHTLLPNMVSAVAAAAPEISFELTYMSSAQQRLALLEGKIDMGMMIGEISSPSVESLRMADESLVVALPANHRLAAKRKLSFADIGNEPVLIGNERDWAAFRDILFRLYAQHGSSPRIMFEASSAAALFGLAAKGLGIAFYAGVPTLYQGSGLVFRKFAPETTIPISLAWRKGPKLALVNQVLKLAGFIKG
jgi:LysR family transcriptional regulator, benzoate and cis,cis-muconate-responsive activator of ben and cat genes